MKVKIMIDKRVKIPKTEHQTIKDIWLSGQYTIYRIAKLYGVSYRLIEFICHPERHERVKQQQKAKPKKDSYTKEQRRLYMRAYRENKKGV